MSSPDDAVRYLSESQYDGLYLGNEFCHFRMPKPEEIMKGLGLCEKNGLSFHLVLPYCPQPALEDMKRLLKLLPVGTEVISNDWGLIRPIVESDLIPVAGRTLISHVADPRASDLAESGDASFRRHLRTTAASLPLFRKALKKSGVTRVEFNNLSQGLHDRLPRPFKGSLYHPCVYITTGRKCLTRYMALDLDVVGVGPCPQPCRELAARIKINSFDREVFLKGNTQFYLNHELPGEDDLLRLGIDRLVLVHEFGF